MLKLLDSLPLSTLLLTALLLGLAPFSPEPHLFEKTHMLASGTLSRPVDIADLLMHAFLPLLFLIRFGRHLLQRRRSGGPVA